MELPPVEEILQNIRGRHPAGMEGAGARADLDARLAQDRATHETTLVQRLVGALTTLSTAVDASSREAATLNRRLIFLNVILVVLTILLVILGAVGLRGHN